MPPENHFLTHKYFRFAFVLSGTFSSSEFKSERVTASRKTEKYIVVRYLYDFVNEQDHYMEDGEDQLTLRIRDWIKRNKE